MQARIVLSMALLLIVDLGAQPVRDREGSWLRGEEGQRRPLRERERADRPVRRPDGEREMTRRELEEGDPLHRALAGRRNAGEVMELLREAFSPELQELAMVTENRREEAPEFARHLVDQATEMLELRERQPERFARIMESRRLDQRSNELAERYRQTGDDAERKRLGKELTELLAESFAARLALQQDEVRDLARELEERQKRLAARERSRAQIIQRRFDQLTGQGELLEW